MLTATVFRAARTLREASSDLWPSASKGGGKGAAHVDLSHLVNIALALAVADPITTAPKMVLGYRNLVYPQTKYLQKQHIGELSKLLFPNRRDSDQQGYVEGSGVLCGPDGLGGDLERLIELMANPDLTDDMQHLLLHSGLEVSLVIGSIFPAAEISYLELDIESGRPKAISYMPRLDNSVSRGRDPNWNFAPPQAAAPIIRRVSLTASVFATLAELWDNTVRFRASTPMSAILAQGRRDLNRESKRVAAAAELEAEHTRESANLSPSDGQAVAQPLTPPDASSTVAQIAHDIAGLMKWLRDMPEPTPEQVAEVQETIRTTFAIAGLLDVPSGTPEIETAANPLAGGKAAAVSDQSQSREPIGPEHPDLTGEREKSQPSSDSQAGHSTQQWSDPHDEPGDGGVDCAAA